MSSELPVGTHNSKASVFNGIKIEMNVNARHVYTCATPLLKKIVRIFLKKQRLNAFHNFFLYFHFNVRMHNDFLPLPLLSIKLSGKSLPPRAYYLFYHSTTWREIESNSVNDSSGYWSFVTRTCWCLLLVLKHWNFIFSASGIHIVVLNFSVVLADPYDSS